MKMKNEIIIYGQDPRTVFDYCRWNTEEQAAAMLKIIADSKIIADKSPILSENCGMGIVTEEKVKMLIGELNKKNCNRDVIVFDTIPERNGRHD